MNLSDSAEINSYRALTDHVRAILRESSASTTKLTQDVMAGLSVQWSWTSPTQGQLTADIPTPRPLNSATLTHLANIALPSALRYPAIVVVDQRKQRLRLVHSNLNGDVESVMQALETLFNQCEVLTTLLIDGPIKYVQK